MALGLPAAFVVAGLFSNFLYGIRPHDIMTFTIVPLFLAVVALVACWIPARRATRIDPQSALAIRIIRRCSGRRALTLLAP